MINLLKQNVKNKTWWVSIISLLILLAQRFGLNLTDYIGLDWQNTLNTIFSLAVLFGISVDTTTISIGSPTVPINSTENKIQENSTSTNISASDSSNSNTDASAKIVVENPDNTQIIGATVNAVSANKPQ